MSWFLIALINPIAHAGVNHLDKYILSRFVKGGSVGALVLFSALFAIIALPIILIINPGVLSTVPFIDALLLGLNGALLVVAILCYLYALQDDETSLVTPLFQLIPLFGFFLGFWILGETLIQSQLWGAGLIVLGGGLLSLRKTEAGISISKKVVLLMVGSSLLYAFNGVVFKAIAVDQGFLGSLFWDMAGKCIFGILLFFLVSSYRNDFITLLRVNGPSALSLNFFGEILALIGEIALVLAVLYAPVVLVQSVGGLQPLFVLIFGILITLFFPHLGQESLTKSALIQKIVSIGIITIGVYLLGV